MSALLRQWPFLEAVLLPALMVGRTAERLAAWNLGSVDDAVAVALALLHRPSAAGRAQVFHSGPTPPRRPIRWGLADVRGLPENPWLVPDGGRQSRWRPTGELLESVLLGPPPAPVDLIVAGAGADLGRLRPGGLLLHPQPPVAGPEPAGAFEALDGTGRLYRKLGPDTPGPGPGGDPALLSPDLPSLGRHEEQARLVEDHLTLARSLARRFQHRGERPEDLEQVAVLALINAAGRYRPERGPFGPFATTSVMGEIKRHFRDRMWAVKVPRSLQERHLAVQAARDELTQTLGASPTVGDIAGHLGASEEEVLAAMEVADTCWPASLDRPGRPDDDPGAGAPAVEDDLDGSLDASLVRAVLPRLSPTERLMVVRIYFEGRSQRQLAAELGISQMQVSRLMGRILTKLRQSMDGPRVGGAEPGFPGREEAGLSNP